MEGREDEVACRWASLAEWRPEEAARRGTGEGSLCSIVQLSLAFFLFSAPRFF